MSDKFKLVLFNVGLAVAIIGSLYWCSEKTDEEIEERINAVNRSYEHSKGVITDIHSYKGHTIEIKYKIGSSDYEYSGGWDKNPNSLGKGDSVTFRYSIEDPQLIISELEDEY